MDDKEILQLLRDALSSEATNMPTSAEVDEFMATPADHSPDTLKRMRSQFVSKVLRKIHPELVKEVDKVQTFGQWIESTRKKARLTRSFVATALGKEPILIERIETEAVLPWELSSSDMSEMIALFRLDIEAFEQLIENTLDQARVNGVTEIYPNEEKARYKPIIANLGPAPPDSPDEDLTELDEIESNVTADPLRRWLNSVRRQVLFVPSK
jgi:ribosome-binding protein aMBF1 (putative translation factor)